MTTGRGSEPVAQCRSWTPVSTTSALDLSSSTVARRTVQTLMGSYVALSTSTRPPLQRLCEPSASGPCRWWLTGDTDPSGPGGTALAIWAECSEAPGPETQEANEPRTRTTSACLCKSPTAPETAESAIDPSRSRKNMYSPIPRRSGRDSMRVRFTPAKANTARQDTSHPGELDPRPQKISAVLAGPLDGEGG